MANGTVGAPASLRVVERRGWRWSNAGQGRAGLGWASTEIENGTGFALVAWHDTTKRIESMNGV